MSVYQLNLLYFNDVLPQLLSLCTQTSRSSVYRLHTNNVSLQTTYKRCSFTDLTANTLTSMFKSVYKLHTNNVNLQTTYKQCQTTHNVSLQIQTDTLYSSGPVLHITVNLQIYVLAIIRHSL